MKSERLFKNVSFFWKISGAFLVCLLIAFFVVRSFLCTTFIDVEKDMENNVLLETQSEADIALSIGRTALQRRMSDVAGVCLESAFELDALLINNSLSNSDKLADYIVDNSQECSFFLLIDSAGEVVRGSRGGDGLERTTADPFLKARRKGKSVSLVDWEIFAVAEQKKSVSAVSIIPGEILGKLNLWPSNHTKQASESLNNEAMAIISVNKVGTKAKPYFLVGGYLCKFVPDS